MLMPMCTSAPRAGAASSPAASAIASGVCLILRPPLRVLVYRHPAPASRACPSGAADSEPCRQRLVEQPRLLARLERHRLAHQARRAPALGLDDEPRAQLGARRGGETLAAPHGLPDLAQLLRARPRPPGLAAVEERRAHLLEEVLLLARRQAARDALPQVPPLGAT